MRTAFVLSLLLVCSIAIAESSLILENSQAKAYIQRLKKDFGYQSSERLLMISIAKQEMYLVQHDSICKTYRISSATEGVGSEAGSGKTPAGLHQITEKFGQDAASGAIFKARQNTGKVADIVKEPIDVPEDLVTSRILWLSGLEPGINKGGNVDSHQRYIYIHGTSEEGLIGQPASHGCIRMYNADVIELFELVETGCFVVIVDDTV